MRLTVRRFITNEKSTIGRLLIDDVTECYTLEDKDRQLENGGIKVPKETAIPRGIYKVIVDWSNRFNRLMPHILDVPQFTGIRIPPGNTDKDTEGCILVGKKVSEDENAVLESKLAYDPLFERIRTTYNNGESILLEVV